MCGRVAGAIGRRYQQLCSIQQQLVKIQQQQTQPSPDQQRRPEFCSDEQRQQRLCRNKQQLQPLCSCQQQQLEQHHHEQVNNNRILELCAAKYHEYTTPLGVLYCNWTWDQVLCWPPTKAGTTATQRCPRDKGIDPTKFATKKCSPEGRWEGKHPGDDTSSPQGWTNYTPCYTPEMLELFRKLYVGSEKAAMKKLEIAERTRTLEIVGFSISLAALLISLAIFCHFRSLRNNRTRIHKNLFVAMVIQVVIRLTLYIDQAIVKGNPTAGQRVSSSSSSSFRQGIDNTPVLCEASYVLLEYARTAMFMWMFIEGLYLHNMVTVTVFQEKSYYAAYTMVGWGVPVLMTAAWAMTTASTLGSTRCWWGYNLNKFFWILEGPRLIFILLNFLFLLNIIRVLVVKLRQSHTSEIEQVRKAVRAAVVLLPLLGITNLVNMTEAPLTRAVWEFGLWSYTTHFLTSFQGLFIAILYCFLNGEVRMAVRKSVSTYLSLRPQHFTPQRRNSAFVSANMTEQVVSTPPPRTATRSWFRTCCSHPSQPTPELGLKSSLWVDDENNVNLAVNRTRELAVSTKDASLTFNDSHL